MPGKTGELNSGPVGLMDKDLYITSYVLIYGVDGVTPFRQILEEVPA